MQLIVCCFIFALEWVEVFLLSVYFLSITKNYIYFYYFALFITTAFTIGSFFVPESPLYLYEKGYCESARILINRIAKMNGSKLASETWLLDKEEILGYAPTNDPGLMVEKSPDNDKRKSSKAEIKSHLKPIGKGAMSFATSGNLSPPAIENPFIIMKKNPQVFMNLIVLTTCWISISFNKYLIAFNLKHLPGNIFINAGISPLADITGHLL